MSAVAAIAAAASEIFKGATSIITNNQIKKINYQEWLRETFPQYRDVFQGYRSEESKTNFYIIALLAFVLIILIVFALRNRSNG